MAGLFFFGQDRQAVPVASVTANAASWRGTSMTRRAFAALDGQTFQARADGRFSLIDGGGPRVGAARGLIDTHFQMGTGADSVVLIQSGSSIAPPLITLGVNGSGQAVGSIHNAAGTTVAAWAATSMGTVGAARAIHMQVAWDSASPINGNLHVWVTVNGARMPVGDFTTVPSAGWTPFQGLYLTTGIYCETGFDGAMLFTQATALAPVLGPLELRAFEISGPTTLTLPSPAVALSGGFTPVVGDLVGTLTLPSLQLTGGITPVVSDLVGTLTLPSLQLSGSFTPVP